MRLQTDFSPGKAGAAAPVPNHVAFIMDGNGRWATQRGLPRLQGHQAGVTRIHSVLDTLARKGTQFVTVFAFSTENWNRPADEVRGLMEILQDAVREQTDALHRNNVRLVHIGSTRRLSPELQQAVADAQQLTRDNTGITLSVALDYGGRDEILEAVRALIRSGVTPEQVDEALFRQYLYTAHCPDPDLIIRTGGELRVSNFLLWQSAYSEFYHTPTLWPDLDAPELERALDSFAHRQRRFGNVVPGK
jgi:undecaprenyl diphosphate synthase